GAEDVGQQILAVAGERERAHLREPGLAHLAEERLGVIDRVALAERVAREEELALLREHARLGGGGAEIAAQQYGADVRDARRVDAASRRGLHVLADERRQVA